MNESLEDMARGMVARHLDVGVEEIDADAHLRDDLHLDPLDLVLIALRIEDTEQREFPIHLLEHAETVRDLARVVTLMRDRGFDDESFTLEDVPVSTVAPSHHRAKRVRHGLRYARPVGAFAHRSERVSSRSR